MIRHRIPAAIAGLGVLFALTACGSSDSSSTSAGSSDCKPAHTLSTVKKGVLTVALTDTPPYSYSKDGKLAGIDSELLKEFATAECLTLEFAPYTYATAVPAVSTGRADVAIGGFYRTEKRAKVVTLSDPVYLDQLAVESKEGISTVDGLLGKRVGTVEGYLWVEEMKKLAGNKARTYADSVNLFQDVKAGRLDIGLDGYGAAAQATKGTDYQVKVLEKDPRMPATLNPTQTSFLLNPKNAELATAVNASLKGLRDNGKLASILESNGLPASAAEVGNPRVV